MTVDRVRHAVVSARPSVVVEVGAGDGRWLADLAQWLDDGVRLLAVDLETPPPPTPGRYRVRADAAALPFPDRSVEAIVARALLHPAVDPPAAVRELARVVAPDGPLAVRDATALPPERAAALQAHLVAAGHPPEPHPGLDPDAIVAACRDAGMTIDSLDRAAGVSQLAGPEFETPAFVVVARRPAAA